MKVILINGETVLQFKSEKAATKRVMEDQLKGITYIWVDVKSNFYLVFNPFLAGTLEQKTSQVYSFDEVLKCCEGYF